MYILSMYYIFYTIYILKYKILSTVSNVIQHFPEQLLSFFLFFNQCFKNSEKSLSQNHFPLSMIFLSCNNIPSHFYSIFFTHLIPSVIQGSASLC